MNKKPRPLPTVKQYRPTLRAFTSAAFSANAIAERECREDEDGIDPDLGTTGQQEEKPNALKALASRIAHSHHCIAYTEEGKICGVSPTPYLDLQRGGLVCAAHKPERGPS